MDDMIDCEKWLSNKMNKKPIEFDEYDAFIVRVLTDFQQEVSKKIVCSATQCMSCEVEIKKR